MELDKKRIGQILFVLVVLSGAFIYRTYFMDTSPQKDTQAQADIGPLCNFKQSCLFETEFGTIQLMTENSQLKPESPVQFLLSLPEQDIKIISAEMRGRDMFMGKIPLLFEPSEPNTYVSDTMIGACITDFMVWRINIKLEKSGKVTEVYFDFGIAKHY